MVPRSSPPKDQLPNPLYAVHLVDFNAGQSGLPAEPVDPPDPAFPASSHSHTAFLICLRHFELCATSVTKGFPFLRSDGHEKCCVNCIEHIEVGDHTARQWRLRKFARRRRGADTNYNRPRELVRTQHETRGERDGWFRCWLRKCVRRDSRVGCAIKYCSR